MGLFRDILNFKPDGGSTPSYLTAAIGCSMGRIRDNNEDNFYFNGRYLKNSENKGLEEIWTDEQTMPNERSGNWLLYGIFDGMGGGSYGELASAAAAKTADEQLNRTDCICPYDITASLRDLFQNMNREVVRAAQNLGSSQMGSTMVSLFFYAGLVWVSNLGDSPGFCLRDGRLEKLTRDHTDEAMMKANGITGRKPYLTQYLGMDPEQVRIEPTITRHGLRKGDRLLLCSDGLTDMVSENQIRSMMMSNETANTEDCVRVLLCAALDAGGRDNVTVMVCDIS